MSLIEHCQPYEPETARWSRAWIYILAATYAIDHPQPAGNTMSDLLGQALPDALGTDLERALVSPEDRRFFHDCLLYFRHLPGAIGTPTGPGPVLVPFAMRHLEEEGERPGGSSAGAEAAASIGWLKLEVVPITDDLARGDERTGLLAGRHPDNLFSSSTSREFEQSMSDAFMAAWHQVGRTRPEGRRTYRGFWSIESCAHHSIEGRSASGAAALGWHSYLNGQRPDPGVVVLAQVKAGGVAGGELDGVHYIAEKVTAIVKAAEPGSSAPPEPFDTIVVASELNRRQAEDALKSLGKTDAVRVVLPEELAPPAA